MGSGLTFLSREGDRERRLGDLLGGERSGRLSGDLLRSGDRFIGLLSGDLLIGDLLRSGEDRLIGDLLIGDLLLTSGDPLLGEFSLLAFLTGDLLFFLLGLLDLEVELLLE